MYGCDEEDLDLVDARPPIRHTEADFEELHQPRKDVTVSNPWVMAKLKASARQPVAARDDAEAPTSDSDTTVMSRISPSKSRLPRIDLEAPCLQTPRASSPSPPARDFHPSDYVPDMRLARDGRLIGSAGTATTAETNAAAFAFPCRRRR